MPKTLKIWIGIILLVLAAPAYCVTFAELGGDDVPGQMSGESLRFAAGPYLQNMTTDAVTIVWQSTSPSYAQLSINTGKATAVYQTSHRRRLAAVRIRGLQPDTSYRYSVSLSAKEQSIERKSVEGGYAFRTFPSTDQPVNFIVYGDTRTYPERQKQVIDMMAGEKNIDFVLHTGDVVGDARKVETFVPEFFEPADKLMCRVPLYAVLGNHERNSPNYFLYFKMPRWYSLQVGSVYVAALDSNVSFDTDSEQYKWLVNDLAKHKNAKWKFLMMHHPTYTSGVHGSLGPDGQPKELPVRTAKKLLPSLAKQFGIRAIFAGHDHVYERSVRDGVNYVIAGGGGAENYADVNGKLNPYRKVFYSGLHYCTVSIIGNRARMVVKTPTGKVIDRIYL